MLQVKKYYNCDALGQNNMYISKLVKLVAKYFSKNIQCRVEITNRDIVQSLFFTLLLNDLCIEIILGLSHDFGLQ